MKNIQSITLIIFAGIIIYFLFFSRKEFLPNTDREDAIIHLDQRHKWDSINLSDFNERQYSDSIIISIYKDSVEYLKEYVKILTKKHNEAQEEINTYSEAELSKAFDKVVGTKHGFTVKEIDSTQLSNSVKKFSDADYYSDLSAVLMDENNYLTIVSTEQDKSLSVFIDEVCSLNDTINKREKQNLEYINDIYEKHEEEKKELNKRNLYTKIGYGILTVTIVLAVKFFSGG